jgi:hypothetical protein
LLGLSAHRAIQSDCRARRSCKGGRAGLRILLKLLLAFGLMLAAQTYAHAFVHVDVDLSKQTMSVRSDSGETYVWPISSGKRGHPTPRGVFRPRALYVMVHSYKYDNAPMPHSIFFDGQFAIHGTNAVGALGRPASHGCIRLAPENAAKLFALVKSQGGQIRVVGSPDVPLARGGPRLDPALSYAPIRAAVTMREWTHNPIGR